MSNEVPSDGCPATLSSEVKQEAQGELCNQSDASRYFFNSSNVTFSIVPVNAKVPL